MVEVILNIFSGRENPTWKMPREKMGEVFRRMMDMKRIEKTPDRIFPGRLGYQGFFLKGMGTAVVDGYVAIKDDEKYRFYEDTNHLEEWLIDEARQRGYGDLIDEDKTRG